MEDGHKDKGRMSVESDHIEDIDLMLPNSPGSVGLGSENSSPEKPKPNRRGKDHDVLLCNVKRDTIKANYLILTSNI